jgi:hypothetical protein
LQAGKFTTNFDTIDLRQLVFDVVSLIRVQLDFKKEMVFIFENVADNVPLSMYTDL